MLFRFCARLISGKESVNKLEFFKLEFFKLELNGIKDGEQGMKQAPQTLNDPRPAASTTAPQTLC